MDDSGAGSEFICLAERCKLPWRTQCLFLEGVQGSLFICSRNGLVIASFPSSSYRVFCHLPKLEGRFLARQAGEEGGGVPPGLCGRCTHFSVSGACLIQNRPTSAIEDVFCSWGHGVVLLALVRGFCLSLPPHLLPSISAPSDFPGLWCSYWTAKVMSSLGSCFAKCANASAHCSSAIMLPSKRGRAASCLHYLLPSSPLPGLVSPMAGGKCPCRGGRRWILSVTLVLVLSSVEQN